MSPGSVRRWLVGPLLLVALVGAAAESLGRVRRSSDETVERLAPGRFLVASRALGDPSFRHTVVLLVDYQRREGAFGLVINRPSRIDLSTVLSPGVEGEELGPVYVGGPVEPLQFALLIRAPEPPEGARRVFGDVHFSSSRELLEDLARPASDGAPAMRAYAGYAGWAVGQLEAEVSVGGWHVIDGQEGAIFDAHPEGVWQRLILIGTAEWARLDAPATRSPS